MPFEVMEVEYGRHVKMWLPEGHDVEEKALNQLIDADLFIVSRGNIAA